MKVFPVVMASVVVLFFGQSGWAAGQVNGESQGGLAVSQDSQGVGSAVSGQEIQAHDKDGNPMTPKEFAKANEARMQSRSAATIDRLQAKQARGAKRARAAAVTKAVTHNSAVASDSGAVPQNQYVAPQ